MTRSLTLRAAFVSILIFATLSHSRRTEATPNAVLIIIGHSEQMKITKIDERLESLMV